MGVCGICLEPARHRGCFACQTRAHASCLARLVRVNPTVAERCIACRRARGGRVSLVTRSMTLKSQIREMVGLIDDFDVAADEDKRWEVLEMFFERLHRYPMIMQRGALVRSAVSKQLSVLLPDWPRASHHHKVLLGRSLMKCSNGPGLRTDCPSA